MMSGFQGMVRYNPLPGEEAAASPRRGRLPWLALCRFFAQRSLRISVNTSAVERGSILRPGMFAVDMARGVANRRLESSRLAETTSLDGGVEEVEESLRGGQLLFQLGDPGNCLGQLGFQRRNVRVLLGKTAAQAFAIRTMGRFRQLHKPGRHASQSLWTRSTGRLPNARIM